jgi:hypothetical protein
MNPTATETFNRVGPVLETGETTNAILAAIQATNRDVLVQDRGSYLRVLVLRRCVLTRQAAEEALGRPFRLPSELERIMPSFKGRMKITEDEVVWTFES